MQNVLNNKKGVSLIEIVATITITSIALLMIYNVLSFNIRQNGINQERSINANIANGALSYVINKDFTTIQTYLDSNTDPYATIDANSCNTLFSDDVNICQFVLSPTIVNRTYNTNNLFIYLMPFNDLNALTELRNNPPEQAPDVFINYLNNLDTSQFELDRINNNVVRVIVIVKSSINSQYDYLLSGVITNETIAQ